MCSSFFLESLLFLCLFLLEAYLQMLFQKDLSKCLLAKVTWDYPHFLLSLFFLALLLFFIYYCFLFYSLYGCSKIFWCSFPVIRCFIKSFSFAFFFLFSFLLFYYFCLLFSHNSFCLRIKLFSLAHKDKFTSFCMLLQGFSVEFTSTAFWALN